MRVFGVLSTLFLVANAKVVIYHRLFHPSFQNSNFLERGTISGDPPTFKESDSLAHDIETLVNPQDTLYQVAMTSEGVGSRSKLVYSSVKACHLPQANAESWIIHTTHDGVPFAFDYFVSPVPSDGTCPKGKVSSLTSAAFIDNLQNMNTTIVFKRPAIPPQPVLRAPPLLTAQGEAVKPPPQKSFIQKYWLYIVGFMLVMIVASPEDPEQPRNGQSSS